MITTLQPASNIVTQLLSEALGHQAEDAHLRPLHYLITKKVSSGLLIFNLLTKELLFSESFKSLDDLVCSSSEERTLLAEKLFLVPLGFDEHMLTGQLRDLTRAIHDGPQCFTNYTILTTTDCNARCFYCYEKGIPHISMNEETANAVVRFILRTGNKEGICLNWFGGEPLLNVEVIDRITSELSKQRIHFKSSMVTNGFLFDELMLAKAKKWNLGDLQITIDGTEHAYNLRKSYKYQGGNAFQRVINNISLLLEENIQVTVRINIDRRNIEDAKALLHLLYKEFGDNMRFSAYSHPLYQEKSKDLINQWRILEPVVLEKLGHGHFSLCDEITYFSCMADDGVSIIVMPDGNLCLCEHLCDSSYVGDIYSGVNKHKTVSQWKERIKETDSCAQCLLYPNCYQVRLCPLNHRGCNSSYREGSIMRLEYAILDYWLKHNGS